MIDDNFLKAFIDVSPITSGTGLVFKLNDCDHRRTFVAGLFFGLRIFSKSTITITAPCGRAHEYNMQTFPLDDIPCGCENDACYPVRWEP